MSNLICVCSNPTQQMGWIIDHRPIFKCTLPFCLIQHLLSFTYKDIHLFQEVHAGSMHSFFKVCMYVHVHKRVHKKTRLALSTFSIFATCALHSCVFDVPCTSTSKWPFTSMDMLVALPCSRRKNVFFPQQMMLVAFHFFTFSFE